MTAEEAIKRIKDHMDVHRIGEHPHIKLSEALNMAISAIGSRRHGGGFLLRRDCRN